MEPILAISLALASAVLALWRRAVTPSGAVVGAALVAVCALRGGWPVLAACGLLVIAGTLLSRLGQARKAALGVAQENGGARSAAHALANVGPAALGLLMLEGIGAPLWALGALAGALADTASSEVGMLAKHRPRVLLLGPRTNPGTDGAMSGQGTAGGALAALLVGSLALGFAGWPGGLIVAAAGLAGTWIDSVLGLVLEPRLPKRVANHLVNALASTSAGMVALILARGVVA